MKIFRERFFEVEGIVIVKDLYRYKFVKLEKE